jgi:transposase
MLEIMADSSGWSEAVDRLRREKEELAEVNSRLVAEKLGLECEIGKLKEELEKARELIDELQRTVARQAAPFRRREALKVAEKKPPGRKTGHRGVGRPRPPHVDHVVEQPLPACPHCGGPVQDRAPLTQYIEELPPVRPVVTRLTTWKGVCPQCGEVHSTHPLQVSQAQGAAGVQLGPRAVAWATLFNKHFGIPMRKTCSILERHFGLKLSAGGLAQMQHRVADKLRPRYEALREQVQHSDANYMDETSWYVGDPHWVLWVCTAPQYTLYHVDPSHGGGVAEKLLGPNYAGVLVTDCHGAYRRMKCPQHKCIAHHLRALHKSRGKNPTEASAYLDAWEQLWQEVIELRRQRDALTAATFAQRRAALEATWDQLLARPVTQPGDRYFLGRMRNVGVHHFGCLYHDVEATNNRAERAIRPAVVARKVSCGNRTQRGARTWQILVSLATTAQQCGREFLDELTTVIPLTAAVPAG